MSIWTFVASQNRMAYYVDGRKNPRGSAASRFPLRRCENERNVAYTDVLKH